MKNLNEVAKELNEVMGLTPPIKTVAVKKDVLLAGIKEAAEQIDPEQDEFTDETIEALKELNLWPGKEEEEKSLPKKGKGSDKPEPKKEEKKAEVKKPASGTAFTLAERIEFLTPLITAGKYNRKQLIEKTLQNFPGVSESSVATTLTDGKNPKYNKFAKLITQSTEGLLSFSKK